MDAAENGHTACVQVLVAAKSDLDFQRVSYACLIANADALILCLYAH
jgi:hypothetical protein